jgi:1-acyl-sn-glycerol-3-phosphate acyltransferase
MSGVLAKPTMRRQHIYTLLTVPVWGFLYTYTAILIVPATFLASFRMKVFFNYLVCFWAKSAFWILGKRVRVLGKENLVKGKKYMVLANHSSLFDILAIVSFYPGISWFGREYLLKIPLFGYLLKTSGFIPMRSTDFRNTREMLGKLVQKSNMKTIALFPEGTRTVDGKFNRFRKGFIHVLKSSDLDVLPITLNGLYSLKPKNRFYIDFNSRINVVVHQPIKNEELISKGDNEIINQVKEVIESAYYA